MIDQDFEVKGYFEYAPIDIDVLDDNRLTPIEKVTFAQLRRFANNQTLQCYPSIMTLAQLVNCSERAIQNSIKKLIELGLILRTERFDGGRQTTTLYTVIGHNAECYKNKNEGCTTCTPPRTKCTDGGAPDAHRTTTSMNNNITLTREADLPNSTEPEKTNELEPQTAPKKTSSSDNEKNQNVDNAVNSNSEEKFTPDNAPEIMKATAELLLLKTGRKYLAWEEILALRELSASQMPARVQKEIDRACERFMRKGKPLSSLRFEYIASALRNQPTRGKKAKNKSQSDVKPLQTATCSDAQAEAEMARIEELQAKFDEEARRRRANEY